MPRTNRNPSLIRQLLLLLVLPLTLSSTGYALFSQQLSLNTSTAKPLYSSSQYMYVAYTKAETPSGSNTNYSLGVTITNKGVTSVTAWQLKFSVPSDVTSVTCASSVTCTRSGTTVTVVNTASNGTLAAGASTATFAISFTSATAKYTLQDIYISGTYLASYQTITGLTVGFIKGTSSKKGQTYTYPYTFTITNSSGQNLSAWQAVCSWSSNPTTSTISNTVNYVTSAASITFTSISGLTDGSNIVFNGSFVINSSSWNITSCTVQGKA